jgi:5-methylcytosine-specific restriction endonuclease McrA
VSYIPKVLCDQVAEQAKHRCGYCLTAAVIVGTPLEVDHLIPEALGGTDEENNLWLACSLCNAHKGDRVAALDPETDTIVPLFNPRQQIWAEHFAWADHGTRIVGRTPIGRATALALQLNRTTLVFARQRWVSVGWHPPSD